VGADASINLNIQPKGTGAFQVVIPGATGNSLTVTGPAVPADGVTVTAAATANPATVSLSATGSDANVNLNLISKGTGAVQVNGVAAAAAPTITLKKGTGLGDYSTASTTYVRVDTTNLVYTVTVPVGQKVLISTTGSLNNSTGTWEVALADGTADNSGILNSQPISTNLGIFGFSLVWVFVGDGASHTFNLQYRTTGGTLVMKNGSATQVPTMTFWLGVAN
jgi:hypothetical protein